MPPVKVSQLIDPDIHCCKSQIIHQLFEPIAARVILSILIPTSPKQDKLMWVPELKGSFTVNLANLTTISVSNVLEPTHVNWKKLWNLEALERLKMFLWRFYYDFLKTKENLSKLFIIIESSCNFCKYASESACHLFLFCPVTKALWFAVC